MPTLARPVSGRWAAVGERGWGGERTAAAWGKREDAQQRQSNSGHPGLGFVLGCIWGISERREWTAKVLGGRAASLPWQVVRLRCKCCVMSLRCVRIAGGHKHLDQVRTSRGCSGGAASGFWELSGRARVKTLEGRITVITSNE